MTWFKVDDGFNTNPKTAMLSDAATALWTRAGSWSCSQLTDGFIPRDMLPFFRKTEETAIELVEAGLWEESEKGWNFHDWRDYQPTRAEVLELREKRREAGRKGGRRSAATRWEADSDTSEDKQTPKQVLKQKDKQVLKQTPKQKSKQVLKQNGSKTEAKFNPVPVPVPNKENSLAGVKESAARFDAPPASTGVDDSENESVDARSSTTVSAPKSTSGKKKPRKKSSKPKPEAHDGQREGENAPAPSSGNPIHDWEPSPAHYELAAELGVDCDECADGFVDWTLREGRVWEDTEAAFRMWMRREKKFKDRDEAKSGSASGSGVRASRMVANAEYNRRLVEAVSERQKQLGQATPAYSEEDFR